MRRSRVKVRGRVMPSPDGAGDGERGEALPALAQPGVVGAVGDEDAHVDGPRHAGDGGDVGGVDGGGVAEAVLGPHRQVDGLVHRAHPHHRHHRHHLLGPHQAVLGGHLGHQQPRVAVHLHPGGLGDDRGVLADPLAVDDAGPVGRPQGGEHQPLHLAQLVLLEQAGAVAAHRPQQLVGHGAHRDGGLLVDADDVVVERGPGDDVLGRLVDVGGVVHHRRRVARPGGDRPLVGLQRLAHHPRAPGHQQHPHQRVAHQGLGGLDGGPGHRGDQVGRAPGLRAPPGR